MNEQIVNAIVEIDEDEALRLVQEALENGEKPLDILASCQEAMDKVGELFQAGDYFLPELMMSGDLLEQVSEVIKPYLAQGDADDQQARGRIVIGTVREDIHNIGKDIVIFMLRANGFEVIDLGVDVPEEKFVEAVKEYQPQILGLSGLLTAIFPIFKSTIEAIEQAGLRDSVKIIIGGGQVDERLMEFVGADGIGPNVTATVELAKKWIG